MCVCVYVCVCVFSLSYAVCVAHTPYYIVICGLSGSTYLPSFSAISPPKKGAIFAKKKKKEKKEVIEHKMRVFIFSAAFVWITSRSEKNSLPLYRRCSSVFMQSTHNSCQILFKPNSSPDFRGEKKSSNTKFNRNPSRGSWLIPCRQTDRQTDMTYRIVSLE